MSVSDKVKFLRQRASIALLTREDHCEKMFTEIADLLESLEKAEPVAWVKVPAGEQASDRYPGYSFNCIECLPAGNYDLYIHPPTTPTDVQTPFDSIKAAIQKDGEYSWSWHCNITMPMVDTGLIGHATANHCAAAVMRFLFGVEPARELPKQELTVDELERYDAGTLNDFGGGNVDWWQDYIRAELDRAHDFYQSQWQAHAKLGQTTDKACSAVVLDEMKTSFSLGENHESYVDGWNDCRAAMLKGEK